MKNKFFIRIILPIIILPILIGSVVLATSIVDEKKSNVLTGEKINKVEDSYQEMKELVISKKMNSKDISKANSSLDKIGIPNVDFTAQNVEVKMYKNELDNRIEKVIQSEKAIIKFNAQNGELLTYTNTKDSFKECELDEKEIKQRAKDLFNKIQIANKKEYDFLYLEKFDNEIWRAGFAKKYEGIFNEGESVKFSFAPQENELVTLAINQNTFANNEVSITENDAKNIAKSYLAQSKGTKMKTELKIVKPNYFFKQLDGDDSLYKNINESRMAYVVTFDNDSQSEVYIDSTTGEVIGGNMLLGGEF